MEELGYASLASKEGEHMNARHVAPSEPVKSRTSSLALDVDDSSGLREPRGRG